jgi:hypothetical protein
MQRVLGFLAIYNRLKNKRGIITKTKKYNRGEINWPPQYIIVNKPNLIYKNKIKIK